MWGYYTAVVVVGIGFLTIGLGWTLLGLMIGIGGFYGFKHREVVRTRLREMKIRLRGWKTVSSKPANAPAGQKNVEQIERRWMFPEQKLADSRREGFEALSECFLLLKRMTSFHTAALFEFDSETRLAYPRMFSTSSEGFRKDSILSVSDGVVGYCLSSGKTVHYSDFKGDARLLGYYSTPDDVRAVAVFPLDRADRRLGALVIDSAAPEAFTPRLDEIRHVAGMLSEILVRVQREETLLVRLEEDRTLKAMTERMAKAGVSIEDVADSLCTLSRDVFPADRVTFVVFDDPAAGALGKAQMAAPNPELVKNSSIVRFRSLKMLDRYVELVARTRKTIRLDDIWENGLMSMATGQAGITTRSILAAPFVFESQVVGVVLLESNRRRAFNAFHETAVGELVNHTSVAVVRAIEYGRMEKTCAIADVVPGAADRIFSEPTLEPLLELIRQRFGTEAGVFEILDSKSQDYKTRDWENPESESRPASPLQKKSIEAGGAFVRIDGKIVSLKEACGEIPAGSEAAFALSAGTHAQLPFGLFHLTLKTPIRAETLHILDRVRALIQIRLILERRERRFGFLQHRDPLTGIFHTAAFDQRLDERIRSARQSGGVFNLILIQPGRLFALKRTHSFAESSRRYAALSAEVERLCGPRAIVGRIGPEDIGVICDGDGETTRQLRTQIERVSETFGFQMVTGCAAFPADADSRENLVEAAARVVEAAAV